MTLEHRTAISIAFNDEQKEEKQAEKRSSWFNDNFK